MGLHGVREVRRRPLAQPVDCAASDLVRPTGCPAPPTRSRDAPPGTGMSRTERESEPAERYIPSGRRPCRTRARRSASARPWRSTGRGRGSATRSRARPAPRGCSVPRRDAPREDRAGRRSARGAPGEGCRRGDAAASTSAASASIGSNCAWSASTVAPYTGNGTSRVSCQVTSSPSDEAASCSSRTPDTSESSSANVAAGRRCTATPWSSQKRSSHSMPSRLASRYAAGHLLRLVVQQARVLRALQQRDLRGGVARGDCPDLTGLDDRDATSGPGQSSAVTRPVMPAPTTTSSTGSSGNGSLVMDFACSSQREVTRIAFPDDTRSCSQSTETWVSLPGRNGAGQVGKRVGQRDRGCGRSGSGAGAAGRSSPGSDPCPGARSSRRRSSWPGPARLPGRPCPCPEHPGPCRRPCCRPVLVLVLVLAGPVAALVGRTIRRGRRGRPRARGSTRPTASANPTERAIPTRTARPRATARRTRRRCSWARHSGSGTAGRVEGEACRYWSA